MAESGATRVDPDLENSPIPLYPEGVHPAQQGAVWIDPAPFLCEVDACALDPPHLGDEWGFPLHFDFEPTLARLLKPINIGREKQYSPRPV